MVLGQARGEWVPERLEIVPPRADEYIPFAFWGVGESRLEADGTLSLAESHTVQELADAFVPTLFREPKDSLPIGIADWQLSITTSIFLSALGITGQDATTRAFWDAVRERLTINAAKGEDR